METLQIRGSAMKKVYLRDIDQISKNDFAKAYSICKKIKTIIKDRQDDAFYTPDRNWKMSEESELYKQFKVVLECKYDVINNLRFFVQYFSGYQLMFFCYCSIKPHVTKIPNGYDLILDKLLAHPDEFVTEFIKITKYLPNWMIVRPPRIMAEVGWDVNGSIVNHDTDVYQKRLNVLYETGIINRMKSINNPNILEIGGGYGALACFIKDIIPNARYFIVDIPESLLFSVLYLSLAKKGDNLLYSGYEKLESNQDYTFIPNNKFFDLVKSGIKFDLVINTLSMAEMSEKQVEEYCKGIDVLLENEGLFYEENHKVVASSTGCDCKKIISDYFEGEDIKSIQLVTIDMLTLGTPTIWTRHHRVYENYSGFLLGKFKPFESEEWIKFKTKKRFKTMVHYKTVGWCLFIISRVILKKIISPMGYKKLVGIVLNFIEIKNRFFLRRLMDSVTMRRQVNQGNAKKL